MITKEAIGIVQEYVQTDLVKLSELRGRTFSQISYMRWAASELIVDLEKNQSAPPLQVIENFRDKMYRYSYINENSSGIFSVACELTEDIIGLLS